MPSGVDLVQTLLTAQVNRAAIRSAVNTLFTGESGRSRGAPLIVHGGPGRRACARTGGRTRAANSASADEGWVLARTADLAAVHADLGWFANKPILHPEHPVVVEAAKAQPRLESQGEGLGFTLCPSKAAVSSSICDKTVVPVFADFQDFKLIGMRYFVTVCRIEFEYGLSCCCPLLVWLTSCVSFVQRISADSVH